jgi:hypothetical protein
MISREEAHEKLHFGNKLDYMAFNDLHEGIEEIYDSIGTCGECQHYKYEQIDVESFRAMCTKDIIFFKQLSSVNKCSCDEFERKEQ